MKSNAAPPGTRMAKVKNRRQYFEAVRFIWEKAKTPEPEKKKEAGAGEELELYSGMRVEVTTGSGVLLFVAKMLGIHGTAATLHQYSDTELPQDGEPIPVKIRGNSDRDRNAVYLEGVISPLPNKVWQVEELTLIKIENAREIGRAHV